MQTFDDRDQWAAHYRANWLKHYSETGQINWELYQRPQNSAAPSGAGIDLSQSRLMLISSAGGYIPALHAPFDAANPLGDYSIRTLSSATPLDSIFYAHDHYDHTSVDQDAQVLVPLRHLDDLVAEGVIGELAPNMVSFMGYQPDVPRLLDETIPAVLEAVQAEQVHAALLVPS